MTSTKKHFSECLRKNRKEKQLSQEGLARLANVDRSYIGRIEQGKVSPSIEIMEKLAHALGKKVNEMC
jgi:transcriptional regulator with XRE-family HTH domain